MTYSLINKCAKNYYNRTFIVQVIAKNVVTCFLLRHSVHTIYITILVGLRQSENSTHQQIFHNSNTAQCRRRYVELHTRELGFVDCRQRAKAFITENAASARHCSHACRRSVLRGGRPARR